MTYAVQTTISKKAINTLPLFSFEGKTKLIRQDEDVLHAIEELSQEDVLGFDTETRPSFKKGESYNVSLLQLAASNCVYLFQLKHLKNYEPIMNLLSAESPAKVGVAVHDDIKGLQAIHKYEPAGFREIATLTKDMGIINTGLRALAALLFGHRISKRAQVSNWARNDLTEAQIQYAATDAWISRELYLKVQELKEQGIKAIAPVEEEE